MCVCVCVCVCVNVVPTLATAVDARDGHEEEHLNPDKEYCTRTCATHGNVHNGNRRLFDISFHVCPADVPTIFRLLPYSPQTIPVHPRYRLCDALLSLLEGCAYRRNVYHLLYITSFMNLQRLKSKCVRRGNAGGLAVHCQNH